MRAATRSTPACPAIRQLFARGQPFTYDLTELGEYYLEYEKMMAHWHAVLPGRVLDVQYEDVVADQAGQTRRLLEFCGLPWEDACLRFWETERAIRTASSEQVRQPIYAIPWSPVAPLRARARAADRDPAAGFAGVWPRHVT